MEIEPSDDQINCFWDFLILENVKLNILFTQKLDIKLSLFDPAFGLKQLGLEVKTKCGTFSMGSFQGKM